MKREFPFLCVVCACAILLATTEIHGATLDLTAVSAEFVGAVPGASDDESLEVGWTTSSESASAGFLVYGIVDGTWFPLGEGLTPGALDSLETRTYRVRVENPFGDYLAGFGIGQVDLAGDETRYGPFELGSAAEPIDLEVRMEATGAGRLVAEAAAAFNARWQEQRGGSVDLIVEVPADGLYRVSHDALLAAGVDLSGTSGSTIAVSFRDEPIGRHLSGLDGRGRWTSTSALEFVGHGPRGDDALYLNALSYRLHLNRSLALDVEGPLEAPDTPVDLVANDNAYSFAIPGPDPWYDTVFYAYLGEPGYLQRSFDLPGLLAEGVADFTVHLSALSAAGGSTPDHHLRVELNDRVVADLWATGWRDFPVSFTVDAADLLPAGNTLRLVAPGDTGYRLDYYSFDKLTGAYPNELPRTAKAPALRPAPAVDLRGLLRGRANYLIVSHPAFLGADLEAYVAAKEREGWNVRVVDLLEVYGAMDLGMATPRALEDFLSLAAAELSYSHVLLVGASSYDPRGLRGPSVSFLPSRYVYTDPVTQYTPCDGCLVDFDDDLYPDVAVGRWPVRSVAELRALISKTERWASWSSNSAMTVTDAASPFDPPFRAQAEKLSWVLGTLGWPTTADVDLGAAATVAEGRAELLQEVNQGQRLTLYSGHGTPTQWSYQGFLRYQDVESLTNVPAPTLVLPLACYTSYAESPDANGLAWQWLTAGEHGAAAVVGAATLSEFHHNEAVTLGLLRNFLGNDATLGDALMLAKRDLDPGYRTVIANISLLGDPTLRASDSVLGPP